MEHFSFQTILTIVQTQPTSVDIETTQKILCKRCKRVNDELLKRMIYNTFLFDTE